MYAMTKQMTGCAILAIMMKTNNAPVSQAIVPSNIFLPFTLIYDMFVSVDRKDVLIETSV